MPSLPCRSKYKAWINDWLTWSFSYDEIFSILTEVKIDDFFLYLGT